MSSAPVPLLDGVKHSLYLSPCCACRILPKICETRNPLHIAVSAWFLWFRKGRSPQRIRVRSCVLQNVVIVNDLS